MILRKDATIEVDQKPDTWEIRLQFPLIKELAVYWSVQKNKWFISCRCSEHEARTIKEMYSR